MVEKYIKKPVVIEAHKVRSSYTVSEFDEFVKWIGDSLIIDDLGCLRVKTLEGHSYQITEDDYIVKGIKGEFYPCKVDIFEEIHERVV